MSRTKRQLFLGSFVSSKTRQQLEYLHDAAVCVDEEGKIKHVVKGQSSLKQAKEKALRDMGWEAEEVQVQACKPGQFFFPGFIDTHIHAPQYPNEGIFGNSSLLDWLEKYTFPLESSLKDVAKARRVYTACVRRTLAHGTTTAAYYATIDVEATNLLADLCFSLGQRAFVGRVCMDNGDTCPKYYRDESAEASLKKTKQTIKHIEEMDPDFQLVSPILTPRFAPACTSECMRDLARLQKEKKLPVQTHISENKGEMELVAGMFPESDSYAAVYNDHGLLTPKTILAHAVHLSETEAQLVSAQGAKVSHCPCSNSSLTSGAARVRWLWDFGITVGLGTDVSGGYSPSILEAARQAALVSRHVAMAQGERAKLTVDEVLHLATRGGAAVVGLGKKLGGFDVGMDFDAQLISLGTVDANGYREGEAVEGVLVRGDVGHVDMFGWEDWGERVAKWLYNGDDRNTRKVWVRGRLVHAKE